MKYQTDLTNAQWNLIKHHFVAKKGQHLVKHSKRKLVNACLYLVKTGCQWRMLPHDFPTWSTVKSFYYRAVESGIWEKICGELVAKVRVDAGRNPEPTLGIIDSQSVKTVSASDERGIDGGKKRKAANVTL